MLQHPAVCASAQGCRPCRAASGAPGAVADWAADGGGPPKPLLRASAWRESMSRFAACRSASRSSAV